MLWAYCRVSSNKQLEGLSMSLQGDAALLSEIARKFKTEIGKRVYADEGRSAYKGDHLRGELGRFLNDMEAGITSRTKEIISKGDVLVIRHLDRLSRLSLSDSMTIYNKILKAGIRIYTTMDGRTYSSDDSNDVQAVNNAIAGFAFANANEESRKKAYYQHKNTLARIEQFISGMRFKVGNIEYPYELGLGQVPFFVTIKGPYRNKYVAPKTRECEILRKVIEYYMSGNGLLACSRLMKSLRCPKSSHQLRKIFLSKALIGVREIKVAGENYELHDYFPRICTNEEFEALYERVQNNAKPTPDKEDVYHSILTGYKSLTCGICNRTLVPTIYKGYRSYSCRTYKCEGFSFGQRHFNRLVLKALQEHYGEKVETIQSDIDEINKSISAHEKKLVSFENVSSRSARFATITDEVSVCMVELMSLREKREQFTSLLSIINLKSVDDWRVLENKLVTVDDNSARLKYRELVYKYIDTIQTFGKNMVLVTFLDGVEAAYLILRERHSKDVFYTKMSIVQQSQYQDLYALDVRNWLNYITKKMIKKRSFSDLTLRQVQDTGLLKEFDVLSIHGCAKSRAVYIEKLLYEIEQSDVNFIEWSRARIMSSGLASQDVWYKFKIEDIREWSNLRFFKYGYLKISGKAKHVEVITRHDISVRDLQWYFRARSTVYLEEMFSETDRVPHGARCNHIKDLEQKLRKEKLNKA